MKEVKVKKKRYDMFGVNWSRIWGKGRQRSKKNTDEKRKKGMDFHSQ